MLKAYLRYVCYVLTGLSTLGFAASGYGK